MLYIGILLIILLTILFFAKGITCPRYFIILLIYAFVIDASGRVFPIPIKYVSFFLLLFVFFLYKTTKREKVKKVPLFHIVTILGLGLPFFLFLFSVLRGVEIIDSYQQLSSMFFWVVFFIYADFLIRKKIDIDIMVTHFILASTVLSIVIITLFAGSIYKIINLNAYTAWASERGVGYIGYATVPIIYLRPSIVLIPAIPLIMDKILLSNKKFLYLILLFINSMAAIFTTSMGIWIGVFLSLLIYLSMLRITLKKKFIIKFLILIMGLLLMQHYILKNISGKKIVDRIAYKFLYGEGITIRVEHIKSILDTISENFFYLLFGQGFGSKFYSAGVGREVIHVEVSHFNLLRQGGIIFGGALLVFFILPIFYLFKIKDTKYRVLICGYIPMFIIAGTNPLLISIITFNYSLILFSYLSYLLYNQKCLKNMFAQ